MKFFMKSLAVIVGFGMLLSACGTTKGPAVPATATTVNPGGTGTIYNTTLGFSVASAYGINASAVCAQIVVPVSGSQTSLSTVVKFYPTACPSGQTAITSAPVFTLGLDNPSGDSATYYLYDNMDNMVGEIDYGSGTLGNISQLCTGPYAIGTAAGGFQGGSTAGADICQIIVNKSSGTWSAINGTSGTSLSY